MKSMPGSDRATPLHGHVKFVPSIRNWFSLTPDPNADTEVVGEVALDRDVGDTPGAAMIKSNILPRRVGILVMSSGPNPVANPASRASIRDPTPSTAIDSARPAS